MSTKAVKPASSSLTTTVFEVQYDQDPAQQCFRRRTGLFIKKGADKIQISVRNLHPSEDMDFVVAPMEAKDGNGNAIDPAPDPFDKASGMAPAGGVEVLTVKQDIGIGTGGLVKGSFEPRPGCIHPLPHTDWHIEC